MVGMLYLFVFWTAGCVEDGLSWVYNEDHIRKLFEPHYIGGPRYQCIHCKAWLWYEERKKICSSTTNPVFSFCCKEGTIKLPPLRTMPEYLKQLHYNEGGNKTHFKEKIRLYNTMFQFTSMGGKVDSLINNSRGPYVFQTLGHNYHYMGTLLPEEGTRPKYAQLYVVDTANECENRISPFVSDVGETIVRPDIVRGIQEMLDEVNEVVKVFRSARDMHERNGTAEIRIRLVNDRDQRSRVYNLPIAGEIGGLIVGDFGQSDTGRDIIVQYRDRRLKRITEYHPLLMSLQYPLLFPYGEDGYHLKIPYVQSPTKENVSRSFVTMKEYYCYQIQHRDPHNNSLLHGGRLFQQFCVDAYSVVRDTRLRYLKREQQLFRVDGVQNVRDAVAQGDLRGDSVGQRIVLPASFTGSPRYMFQNYQDSLAILSYTIEYQKRGLPHAHILLWLKDQNNVICGPEIDKIISAEIPDKVKDSEGFNAVANYMMHGPCGLAFPRASCMEEGRCKKRFPKAFQGFSTSDDDGFPLYRRRETDASVLINDIALDNSQSRAIKYLFKYINKGPDRASVVFETTTQNPRDEIRQFVDCRVLRTVNGTVYQTFKEACHALGLLGDDKEWKMAIEEASVHASGRAGSSDNSDDHEGKMIEIPKQYLITVQNDPVSSIVKEIYPDFDQSFADPDYLRKRAIVTPYNITTEEVNQHILNLLPTETRTYYSCDTIAKESDSPRVDIPAYSTEYLNCLSQPGNPEHELILKIGAVVMCLRNINPSQGLCNVKVCRQLQSTQVFDDF
ncbi:DNA helicase PIF1, ATP-dependent [Corchorus olitorius]|uniref:DNA helicase PIF1, ATP-dependent n=1 Tax=Corchorus olitorius TaxID=93759 RepID=A0A1R3KUF0_9ROSI|nr:DNA helicase PIF1, ATP-dependent [Corchorus olitorius]